MTRRRTAGWAVATLLLIALATLWGVQALRVARVDAGLRKALATLKTPDPSQRVDCQLWRAGAAPLVLLALGQSNAGNHGQPGQSPSPPVQVMDAGACAVVSDPLPGATGRGSSLWPLLPARLRELGLTGPVVLQLLAVDATTLDDWVRDGSPLRQRLQATLAANARSGLSPSLVLWQQGEADASAGTSAEAYRQGLLALASMLAEQCITAPVLLAQSTVCRSAPAATLRQAVGALIAQDTRFAAGPDTDALNHAGLRHDGCHWSNTGRAAAATAWASAIARQLAAQALRPAP